MLAIGFFVVALIYSAVGFGGGSTYIALLALSDHPAEVIPSLRCPAILLWSLWAAISLCTGETLIGGCPFRFWPLSLWHLSVV